MLCACKRSEQRPGQLQLAGFEGPLQPRGVQKALDPSAHVSELQHTLGNHGMGQMLSKSPVTVKADPQPPTNTGTVAQTTQGAAGANPHPFTAIFSIAMVSSPSCSVPQGQHGATKLAKYRLFDANHAPVTAKTTIGERFTKISGDDSVFNLLKPNFYQASGGVFDDCYGLYSPNPLPAFSLEVEQNHLVGTEVISKNLITYSPFNIMIRVCPRTAQGFSSQCRRF